MHRITFIEHNCNNTLSFVKNSKNNIDFQSSNQKNVEVYTFKYLSWEMNLQIKVNSVLALSDPNSDDQHFKRFERKFRKRLKDSKIVLELTKNVTHCKKDI